MNPRERYASERQCRLKAKVTPKTDKEIIALLEKAAKDLTSEEFNLLYHLDELASKLK